MLYLCLKRKVVVEEIDLEVKSMKVSFMEGILLTVYNIIRDWYWEFRKNGKEIFR